MRHRDGCWVFSGEVSFFFFCGAVKDIFCKEKQRGGERSLGLRTVVGKGLNNQLQRRQVGGDEDDEMKEFSSSCT